MSVLIHIAELIVIVVAFGLGVGFGNEISSDRMNVWEFILQLRKDIKDSKNEHN